MGIMKSIRGYRTLVVQVATMIIGLLVAFGVLPASEWAGVTQETAGEYFDYVAGSIDALIGSIMVIIGIVNTWLRFITKGRVGDHEPSE